MKGRAEMLFEPHIIARSRQRSVWSAGGEEAHYVSQQDWIIVSEAVTSKESPDREWDTDALLSIELGLRSRHPELRGKQPVDFNKKLCCRPLFSHSISQLSQNTGEKEEIAVLFCCEWVARDADPMCRSVLVSRDIWYTEKVICIHSLL